MEPVEKSRRNELTILQPWRPVVSTVIVGAKRVEQLRENVRSTEVVLDSEDMTRLDAVSRLPIEYPGWLLNRAADRAS